VEKKEENEMKEKNEIKQIVFFHSGKLRKKLKLTLKLTEIEIRDMVGLLHHKSFFFK
jgi:hypothetical protein